MRTNQHRRIQVSHIPDICPGIMPIILLIQLIVQQEIGVIIRQPPLMSIAAAAVTRP
jgi:hypothetical protein